MKRLAIFASGSGSNFQAILDSVQAGTLVAEICLIVCDKPDAYVIERARQADIPALVLVPAHFSSKQEYERSILAKLELLKVDYLVLAGYMRLIGETLLTAYEERIVNLHPSLLPSFPGKDAIKQALEAGVKETGVTVHIVDAGMDTGPIIAQEAIAIDENETVETLTKKIHQLEHQFFSSTLQKWLNQ